MKLIDVTPTTDIIHSMRRAGYKWYEAVLDIVDNAVDALKTQHDKTGSPTGLVTIKYLMKDKKVTGIVIADNATGIDEATLQKIMKMGWSAKRGTDQLGTFGMGIPSYQDSGIFASPTFWSNIVIEYFALIDFSVPGFCTSSPHLHQLCLR